jgi:hypothetical protein
VPRLSVANVADKLRNFMRYRCDRGWAITWPPSSPNTTPLDFVVWGVSEEHYEYWTPRGHWWPDGKYCRCLPRNHTRDDERHVVKFDFTLWTVPCSPGKLKGEVEPKKVSKVYRELWKVKFFSKKRCYPYPNGPFCRFWWTYYLDFIHRPYIC